MCRASAILQGSARSWSETYVTDAAATFEGLADVLAVGFGARLAPNTDEAAQFAHDPVLRALRADRWHEARYMAESVLEGLPPDHDHHQLRVNLWMAKQELGGNEVALRTEIKSWMPPADNDPRYRLAKAALLDDEAEAIAVLDAFRTDGALNTAELQTWPLVKRLQERSPRFDKHLKLALVASKPKQPVNARRCPKHRR